MTEEEKAAAAAEVAKKAREEMANIANSAASSHAKRNAQAIDDRFAALTEQISALTAAVSSQPAPAPVAPPDDGGDDRVKALSAQLNKMKEDADLHARQRVEQEQQRKTQDARGLLKDSLAEAGVPADRLKQAVGYLFDAEKRVAYSDAGDLEFLIQEDGYVDRLDVASGVKKFLDSGEGKMYLPARDVSGSGNKGGNAPRSRPSAPSGGDTELENMSPAELLGELGKAMMDGLG